MTQDEQNAVDLERMEDKRNQARRLFDDFMEWHMPDRKHNPGAQVLIIGMTRDIRRATEPELDRLIEEMTDRNDKYLMKKLSEGID